MIKASRSRAIRESRLRTTPSHGAESEKSEGDTSLSDSHEDRNIPAASAGLPSTPPTLDSKQITLLQMAIRSRSKVPHQCTMALKQASKANIKTTESIFFEYGGLVACAAYILTKYESRRKKAKNRPGRVRLLDLLEELPVEARQSAALRLAATGSNSQSDAPALALSGGEGAKAGGAMMFFFGRTIVECSVAGCRERPTMG
ncbi:hypothetical protein F5883DRAFT_184969 [Diaporthe sp. PMI_573]|nr:hypothetical protein F5883DRAFT_184969 [Diaporthaceae sp. PMI_573]